jgi:hypothetical protein
MAVTKTVKRLVHKVDHTVLMVMGGNKGPQKKLIIPKQLTAAELKRGFISDYVKAQPSLLQVILLMLYVNLRHFIGSAIRLVLRRPRGGISS